MKMMEIVKLMEQGKTEKQIEVMLRNIDLEKSKEDGKCFGECESCGQETCLVEEVGLCGPCCFGEAATANGEW